MAQTLCDIISKHLLKEGTWGGRGEEHLEMRGERALKLDEFGKLKLDLH